MELTASELKDLVAALSQSDIAELTLKSASFELTLRKQGMATALSPLLSTLTPGPGELPSVSPPPAVTESVGEPPALPSPPAATPPPGKASDLAPITSPMVGTFYRSPAPDEPAFVDVGERIRTGQTVCIIEAMKLMNELEAEIAGEIVEILVNNGEPVEFGQTLMLVRVS
ncbi:MAG: acetyl-CoA carboxylase biotin carboxyl carrier protein [Cyanobacteriota bacterium]|nr:acetyl-CoA carboxylase biotin carboxyl carrier protein [Cyanobacteriota bacterium]